MASNFYLFINFNNMSYRLSSNHNPNIKIAKSSEPPSDQIFPCLSNYILTCRCLVCKLFEIFIEYTY